MNENIFYEANIYNASSTYSSYHYNTPSYKTTGNQLLCRLLLPASALEHITKPTTVTRVINVTTVNIVTTACET